MKKKIALAIVGLSIFSGVALAQSIKYGVKAGINVSRIYIKSDESSINILSDAKMGFNGGGFVTFNLGKGLSIQPEVHYSQLGSKTTQTIKDPMTGDISTKLNTAYINYLTLPVLFKYTFLPQKFSIYLGPQLGFLLTAKSKMIGKINGTTVLEEEEDGKEFVKSTDFAGIIGAEYSFPMGIVLSARYQTGLININKGDDASKIHINSFGFTVGYTFGK